MPEVDSSVDVASVADVSPDTVAPSADKAAPSNDIVPGARPVVSIAPPPDIPAKS